MESMNFDEKIVVAFDAMKQKDYRQAIAGLQQAAEIARLRGELTEEVFARYFAGMGSYADKDYVGALEMYDWVVQQLEQRSDLIDMDQLLMDDILSRVYADWVTAAAHVPGLSGDPDELFVRGERVCAQMGWQTERTGLLHAQSVAYLCRHENECALPLAEEALALKRLNLEAGFCGLPHYMYVYGQTLYASNRLDEATQILDEGAATDARAFAFHYQMAVVSCLRGEDEIAYHQLERQLMLDEDADSYLLRALLAHGSGADREARADLRQASILEEKDEEGLVWMAALYGDAESAERLAARNAWGQQMAAFVAGSLGGMNLYRWIEKHHSLNDKPERLGLLWALKGWTHEQQGHLRQARRCYGRCLAVAVPGARACLWAARRNKRLASERTPESRIDFTRESNHVTQPEY